MSEYVEIPGYADVLKREHELRSRAFSVFPRQIGGVTVHHLTPWHLMLLDEVRNGYVCACEFESEAERIAHAIQFVWIVSEPPDLPQGAVAIALAAWRKWRIGRKLRKADGEQVLRELADYLDEAFYDAPKASGGGSKGRGGSAGAMALTSWIAVIVDDLAAAGYPWSEYDALRIPMVRLWQYIRLSLRRLFPDASVINPSDAWAALRIHEINAQRASEAAQKAKGET